MATGRRHGGLKPDPCQNSPPAPHFSLPKGIPVDLKVPINIVEEFSEDDEVHATGLLDMASGDISRVDYEDYDVDAEGLPCDREDYEFSSGMLSNMVTSTVSEPWPRACSRSRSNSASRSATAASCCRTRANR